jgi:2-polyprenyl-3-methyl-5-hydroxy-6-metoxy-1,4-benzoquinol methylase
MWLNKTCASASTLTQTHADVIHDLGSILSVPDSDFDDIVCRHVAEHVPDVMSFIAVARITKPGGRITITTPHYSNPDWATDPTHRNHFNSYSFNFHR